MADELKLDSRELQLKTLFDEQKKKIEELEETINKLREQLALRYSLEDKIAELEKENAELKETLKTYNGCGDWDNDFHACRVYLQHEELQMYIDQLTKAKELLKWALHADPEHDDIVDFDTKWKEAEQFLKENK